MYFGGDVYTDLVLITKLDTYFTFEILLAAECRRVGIHATFLLHLPHGLFSLSIFLGYILYILNVHGEG